MKPDQPDPWERYRQKRKFDPGVGYTPEASDGGRDWPMIVASVAVAALVIVALVVASFFFLLF